MPRSENENFCQQPSRKYMDLLDKAGGDPRSAAGLQALSDLNEFGHWMPTLDARDARYTAPEKGGLKQPIVVYAEGLGLMTDANHYDA